jgi:hypothetical protein
MASYENLYINVKSICMKYNTTQFDEELGLDTIFRLDPPVDYYSVDDLILVCRNKMWKKGIVKDILYSDVHKVKFLFITIISEGLSIESIVDVLPYNILDRMDTGATLGPPLPKDIK